MAYMEPLENEDITDDAIVERFTYYQNTRGFTPNSIRTMARRPNIVKAFMQLNQAVLYEGTVGEDLKMMVSLMSSFATGCLYCQSHMANLSHIYNVSKEKIDTMMDFEQSEHFTDAERAALDFAYKAAQVPNGVTQSEYDRLAIHFDENQIVEIIASIALFGFLNRWNDSMATSLEPVANERAFDLLGQNGWSAGKHTPA